MRLRALLIVVLAAVVVPAFALGSAQKTDLEAKLLGKSEAPKGAPAGHGEADIKITGNKVCWTFKKLGGIDKPTASHIHKGAPGKAGPVVIPLGGKFTLKGCINSPMARAVAAHPGAYYVNVHTAKFPGGAVRGQLKPEAVPGY